MRVSSSDGVIVAVHELAGEDDAGRPELLVAHATGFHGRAYLPMAAHLSDRYHVVGLDMRGHGDTPLPPDWTVDWQGYGDDALAVGDAPAAAAPGRPLVGFGHSMGGAALLLAASRRPELFSGLVLYEPIVFPPDPDRADGPSPLIVGARRRRATFPSIEAAIANYASKPPLGAFDPDALDAYVRYGFAANGDGVRLKCAPEHEAQTFEQSTSNGLWELLATIETPTVVISGRVEADQPSRASGGRRAAARRPVPGGSRSRPLRPVHRTGPGRRPGGRPAPDRSRPDGGRTDDHHPDVSGGSPMR